MNDPLTNHPMHTLAAESEQRGMPVQGSLVQIRKRKPLFCLTVGEVRVRIVLTMSELWNFRSYQKACIVKAYCYPQDLKPGEWHEIVRRLLRDVRFLDGSSSDSML